MCSPLKVFLLIVLLKQPETNKDVRVQQFDNIYPDYKKRLRLLFSSMLIFMKRAVSLYSAPGCWGSSVRVRIFLDGPVGSSWVDEEMLPQILGLIPDVKKCHDKLVRNALSGRTETVNHYYHSQNRSEAIKGIPWIWTFFSVYHWMVAINRIPWISLITFISKQSN